MISSEFARKARRNEVEVEDLLGVIHNATEEDIEALDAIEAALTPGLQQLLRPWFEIVRVHLEDGCDGVVGWVASPKNLPFALGLLEELGGTAAAPTLARLVERFRTRPTCVVQLASSINLLCSFEPRAVVDVTTETKLREFLHGILDWGKRSNRAHATALYALRTLGNERTLEKLLPSPDPKAPFSDARALCIEALKARLSFNR